MFDFSFSQFPVGQFFKDIFFEDIFLNLDLKRDRSVIGARLTIGRDRYFKTIKMDKKINLLALIYLLDKAVKEIESQFGKEFKLPLK